MSIAALVDIVHSGSQESWTERNRSAFESLFGANGGRYSASAAKSVALRAPGISSEAGIPFAAFIDPSNPTSGGYSGLSFVIFPVPNQPSLVGLVVGTNGLDPDQGILGRPGHARKVQAICSWLNRDYGAGQFIAWAKQDPTRTDLDVPMNGSNWQEYQAIFNRYGKWLYALYRPTEDQFATRLAITAFLDLMFEERGYQPLTAAQADAGAIRQKWFEHLMPGVDQRQVENLLVNRRYVVLQGPPGTGKTRMATEILRSSYAGFGRSIQFHPNTTYENFIGGLSPAVAPGDLGLRFAPTSGALMEAAAEALANPSRNYLLHIDEINRADLGKILGEAIFLLEPSAGQNRRVELAYDYGPPFYRTFMVPENLHILGTMNSADRSIAILDIAVRRRFAFLSVWPRMSVVEALGCKLMRKAFSDLLAIFVEYAGDEAFVLMPGHSYFLEAKEDLAKESLLTNLVPLLEEYLAQGYVSGFAEPVRGYVQQLRSL